MATTVIRNFIAKQLFKKQGAIANKKAVEFSANALENRLLTLGIDTSLIRSEQELNQILNLVKQAEDQAFNQKFGNVLSRSNLERKGEVFDMTGKKIDSRSQIMGGKQVETEAEIAARMSKENKEAAERLREKSMAKAFSKQDIEEMDQAIFNLTERQGISGDSKVDAEFLAEELAALRGIKYDDMPTKERLDIYGQAYDKLQMDKFRRKETKQLMDDMKNIEDPEDMATGGRAGYMNGTLPMKKDGFLVSPDFSKMTPEEIELYKLQMEIMKKGFEKKPSPEGLEKLKIQQQIREQQRKDRGLPEEIQLMAQGGRAGYKFGIGPLIELLTKASKTSPLQFGKNYMKNVREKTLKANETGKFMDLPLAEVGIPAASGAFITQQLKKKLRSMNEDQKEINFENFKKELENDKFYKKYPDLKDKVIERYVEMEFGEKRADGGRIGYKDGKSLLDFIDVQASGSKSGKQQLQGAPDGITIDSESINAIIKADIPISQKINLIADYQYGKGRNKFENRGKEIFLDEGGFKNRNVGLDFNREGDGFGGKIMYNLESGDPTLNIKFNKRFAEGGRIGLKDGMDRRTFLKIMGGLASVPILGKFFKPAKVASKAVKAAPVVSKSTPPAYFFELANKIKTLGRVTDGPAERIKIHSMPAKDGKSELMLTEDIGTGEMQIKKIGKEEDMTTKVETMEYQPGSSQADETTQGIPADSYDEYTEVNSRIYKDEFNEPMVEDGINVKEIVEEVTDQAPSIKKAGGGIARMLGE